MDKSLVRLPLNSQTLSITSTRINQLPLSRKVPDSVGFETAPPTARDLPAAINSDELKIEPVVG